MGEVYFVPDVHSDMEIVYSPPDSDSEDCFFDDDSNFDFLENQQKQSLSVTDLQSYLSQSSMTVRTLLQHPLSNKFILAKNHQIISFFSVHINELLNLMFSTEESTSLQAYTVFGYLQSDLIDSILKSSDFHEQVLSVLENKREYPQILARVCKLTLLAITMNVDSFPDLLDFVIFFPNYIENDPFLTFYEEILQEDPCYSHVQEWLLEKNFHTHILNMIKTISFQDNKEVDFFSDKKCQRLTNLFKLIRLSQHSLILKDAFRTEELVDAMMKFENLPHQAEDAKWEAIDSLCDKKSYHIVEKYANKAFQTVSCGYLVVHRYRLSALHILQKLLHYNKPFYATFKNRQMIQVLTRLIFQFQTNTFVLLQVKEFLETVFKIKELNITYAEGIIPFLICECLKLENFLMSSFAFTIIEKCMSCASKDTNLKMALLRIDGFSEFVSGPLKTRRKMLKENYGGRLPVTW